MAKLVDVGSIGSYFESLSDPRHTRNRKHLLVDIVVIAVCGILCGCDGPTAIHRWAKHRALLAGPAPRLAQRHPLARLHPSAARGAEARGLPTLLPGLDQPTRSATDADDPARLVAIDGKTCRRSHDRGEGPRRPAHRQRLGQRGGDRPGPGRHRRQVQRDHGHPAAPGADRPGRHAHHDRRDGLPEGDRRAGRHRRRRLRHRRQGQPAEAPGRDPGVLPRSPGARPGRPAVPVPRDARRGARPHRRAVVLSHEGAAGLRAGEGLAVGQGDRLRGADHAARRRHGVGRGAVLPQQPLSQRQAVRRGGARPLGDRVDALGAGRELPRGRQPDPRADVGQQPELAAALRRDAAEASSRQGQPPREDDLLHASTPTSSRKSCHYSEFDVRWPWPHTHTDTVGRAIRLCLGLGSCPCSSRRERRASRR